REREISHAPENCLRQRNPTATFSARSNPAQAARTAAASTRAVSSLRLRVTFLPVGVLPLDREFCASLGAHTAGTFPDGTLSTACCGQPKLMSKTSYVRSPPGILTLTSSPACLPMSERASGLV